MDQHTATIAGGRYRLLAQIGEGGMSRVYLALDTVLNKQWAAKEIKYPDDPIQRELIIKSIETEANMIKRLDHPAIPRIVDIVDEDGILYVIMDYVEGRTLAEIIDREGPQAEDDVADWGLQLCDVLSYLHGRTPPVIYRDMKPANVMLKPNGLVQVIDFGIARERRDEVSDGRPTRGDTDQLGTRGFAPPEQYGDTGQTDERSDVYALGATLYNLLTGRSPADPPYEIVPVRQVDAELSAGIERIVAKATQQNPGDRYQNCAEMAYDLAHYRENDEAHRAGLRRTWRIFLGGIIATVAFFALGVAGTVGRAMALDSDYGYWMGIAGQTSDVAEAADAYARAATILPTETEPYEGLADLYRADQVFTSQEETQFRSVLLPHLAEVRQAESWSALAFDIGKLYWYNYDASGELPDDAARSERIRAAAEWMADAAIDPDFEQHELAQAYADIAAFNTEIVPLINEGSDAGLYRPYFDQLVYLVGHLDDEGNDVMTLQAANLALDALMTYPRKFRADGVKRSEMRALVDGALALANGVDPTTDALDAEQSRVFTLAEATAEAVDNAYVDGEVQGA